MTIPSKIAAQVLFNSDRTCCVCRKKGKPVQIHHIDENNLNNEIENLAVLCFDCHTETQISGGFHRKLNAEVVELYRENWLKIVQRERLNTIVDLHQKSNEKNNMKNFSSMIESFRENQQYSLLASFYDLIGNKELRDKYIEKAISQSNNVETLLILRGMQGKGRTIDPQIVQNEIQRLTHNENWSQLARLYVNIENWTEAVRNYCKGILKNLDRPSKFTSAFYLKEMIVHKKLHEKLFQEAFEYADKNKDLWWQIRALEELGWDSELDDLIKTHMKEIKEMNHPKFSLLLRANDKNHCSKTLKD